MEPLGPRGVDRKTRPKPGARSLFEPLERPAHGAPSSQYSIQFGELPHRDFTAAFFDPPCAACQFPLPFRLLVTNPAYFSVQIAGAETLLVVRDVQQEAFDKRTAIAQVNGMELDRDRRGIVRYSDVEVQFPYDVLRSPMVAATLGFQIRDEPSPLTEDWLKSLYPELRKVSLFAVNRLLRGYSFLSGEHWIRPIVEGDIFYVQTGWLFPGISSPIEMMVGAPGHSIGLQAHPFSDWFHEELARWLASEKDVPIWLELVQDAREYLEVGRFRHVVIDSRTAVEVYVDQTLVTCFKQQALSPAEAAIQLKLSRRPAAQSVPSLEEAIRLARINDKLKYGLKRALGIELARRKVWNDWLAVKEVREDSVHYGEDVSEEQARQCLEVVETLISAVHEAGSPVSASLKPEAK